MKLKMIKLVAIVAICIAFCACDEIIDPDISNKKVSLYSPSDSVTITANTVLFKWNALEGAAKYRLQVVSPTFSAISSVLADTIITNTQFSLALNKGSYQWTVSAINNTAMAYSDTLSLTVALSGDLSLSTVSNLYPTNAAASKNITFIWDKVFSAKSYEFVLWSPSWQSGSIVKKETISTNQYTITGLSEGTYAWGVKAINDSTETPFSNCSITIDVTNPLPPTLTTPAEASTTNSSSVTFQWTRATDTGSTLFDSLYVATDEQFINCIVNRKMSSTSATENITTAGTYYWRVRTIDAAGNKSEYSTHTFIKQ
ncbi:MAG: hypothetical protein JXQ69_09375 [Paludibacteraceae bacterium]|nr:hypothetical protein [Paludibacteraceae bacterium]MBN2788516.1 hypothetical protein [Paludibacteraceae bacterium]